MRSATDGGSTRYRALRGKVSVTLALVAAAGLIGAVVVLKNLKTLAAPASASAAASSAAATWFLGGSSNELPQCFSCEASLPVSGSGGFGSILNTANDQLSPAVATVASDFSVQLDTAPGGAATRTFVLYFRADPSKGLRCDITGSKTNCNSGAQTLAMPPRSALLIDAANSGNAAATRLQFSWRAAPQ